MPQDISRYNYIISMLLLRASWRTRRQTEGLMLPVKNLWKAMNYTNAIITRICQDIGWHRWSWVFRFGLEKNVSLETSSWELPLGLLLDLRTTHKHLPLVHLTLRESENLDCHDLQGSWNVCSLISISIVLPSSPQQPSITRSSVFWTHLFLIKEFEVRKSNEIRPTL